MKKIALLILMTWSISGISQEKLEIDGKVKITTMDASESDSIVVWNSDGTLGIKSVGCGLAIGDSTAGGIIFYLDPSGCHGLVSAKTNQDTTTWSTTYTNTTAFASCVGCGDGNTSMIVYNQGSGTYAAKVCYDLPLNGFSDWYLPSKYELNLMYKNIGQGNTLGLGNIGGFSDDYYWSSTEHVTSLAWFQYFGSGAQFYFGDKGLNLGLVRCVRGF